MDIAAGASAKSPRQTRTVDSEIDLYAMEADAFAGAVLDGRPPAVSEADTLGNMGALDALRSEIKLVF